MKKQITAENETPRVVLVVLGDLEIEGSAGLEILAETDQAEDLQFELAGDVYRIECRDDLTLQLPRGAQILVEKVEGDADLADLSGMIQIDQVAGDLSLRSCGQVVSVENVSGDCSVESGSGPFSLQNLSGDLDLENQAGDVSVDRVNGDCSLAGVNGAVRIGEVSGDLDANNIQAPLAVGRVGGDAQIGRVSGPVSCEQVSGDLEIEQTGQLSFHQIGGDASFLKVAGSISGQAISGDAALNSTAGRVDIEQIGGDFSSKGQMQGARARAGGDVSIMFQGPLAGPVDLTAGGDLVCHLPDPADAQVDLVGGGEITIRLPDRNFRMDGSPLRFTLGQGTFPLRLVVGGSTVLKASSGMSGEVEARLEEELNHLTDRITHEALQKAAWTSERAAERARAATEKMNERMRAALNRLERRGIRMPDSFREPFMGRVPGPMEPPFPPVPPTPPVPGWQGAAAEQAPASSPATDEERMLILKMVQEKKITVEQAEELLQALEGGEQENL